MEVNIEVTTEMDIKKEWQATAANWRFGATAAVARRKGNTKLKGNSPQKW